MKTQLLTLVLSILCTTELLSQNTLESILFENYDINTNLYTPSFKSEFTYNTNGDLSETNSETYFNNTWNYPRRTTYTYDAAGNITKIENESYVTSSNIWSFNDKYEYQYSNNQITNEIYTLDQGRFFLTIRKTEYIYTNNLLTETIKSNYDHGSSTWLPEHERTSYTYNNANVRIGMESESFNGTSWVPNSKTTYTVNGSTNKVEEATEYYWNFATSSWAYNTRTMYTLDANGNRLSEIQQASATGQTLQNGQKIDYHYDHTKLMSTYSNPENSNLSSRYQTTNYEDYPFYHKVISADMNSYQGGAWVKTGRITYIYSDSKSLSNNEAEETTISIYPNPVKSVLHIITKDNFETTALIVDINGRVVLKQKLESMNAIPVENLKSGLYILQLQSEKGNSIRRILKQ